MVGQISQPGYISSDVYGITLAKASRIGPQNRSAVEVRDKQKANTYRRKGKSSFNSGSLLQEL